MSYKDLPNGERSDSWTPRPFDSLATGVVEARQDHTGRICLLYTDGTVECADCPELEMLDAPTFWGVVGAVQDKRP